MEKLLLNTKEVENLVGMSYKTFQKLSDFPKPVNIVSTHMYQVRINLYKAEEVKNWVNSLQSR